MKLFVYGTLKTGKKNHLFLQDCEFLGRGYILGELYLYKPVKIPFLLEGKNLVYGELYDIPSKAILESIRWLELNAGYVEKIKTVHLEDRKEKAVVYLYNRDWAVRTKDYELIREF